MIFFLLAALATIENKDPKQNIKSLELCTKHLSEFFQNLSCPCPNSTFNKEKLKEKMKKLDYILENWDSLEQDIINFENYNESLKFVNLVVNDSFKQVDIISQNNDLDCLVWFYDKNEFMNIKDKYKNSVEFLSDKFTDDKTKMICQFFIYYSSILNEINAELSEFIRTSQSGNSALECNEKENDNNTKKRHSYCLISTFRSMVNDLKNLYEIMNAYFLLKKEETKLSEALEFFDIYLYHFERMPSI